MKTKLLTISLLTVLTLVLSAEPTFAYSKKYSNEKQANSYTFTQGKSQSDPDNNGKGPERNNGKSDKPGSIGGVNKLDQDGNNGCGNDLDREDDNEGWCGQKPKKVSTAVEKNPCESTVIKPTTQPKVVVASVPVVQKAPVVLTSVAKLPQTGNEASSYLQLIANIALAVTLVLFGLLANLLINYRESKAYETR